jgi:hypothetical protein
MERILPSTADAPATDVITQEIHGRRVAIKSHLPKLKISY